MKKFNLSTRIELFAICTSIEIDIKTFILTSATKIEFNEEMLQKAHERRKGLNESISEDKTVFFFLRR